MMGSLQALGLVALFLIIAGLLMGTIRVLRMGILEIGNRVHLGVL